MDSLSEILQQINLPQTIAILAALWFFYARLDRKIEKGDDQLSKKIDDLSKKTDDLSKKIDDVDRRLCRIEGSLATQGHCLFHQPAQEKKAE